MSFAPSLVERTRIPALVPGLVSGLLLLGPALAQAPTSAPPPSPAFTVDPFDGFRLAAQVPEGREPSSSPEGTDDDGSGSSTPSIQGPPPPRPPDVINRDDRGNATVRALRLEEPLDVDGELNESVYRDNPAISGFIQSVPDEGAPATEETEAWVTFDEENVYISARVHEEVPEAEWVANEMRRDANGIGNNDNFGVVIDTYYDRRNGYFFYTNPLGALADVQLTNEGNPNFDWDPVWDVQTGRFPGGWTLEMAIPFESLRYRPGREQVWGLQLRRGIQRKNEWSHLTFVSSAAAGTGRMGATRISRAATLVGIEAPSTGPNIDLKPYAIGGLRTDRAASPPTSSEGHADWGVDLKWGVTQNLTADFTYNTDFAQVEVDEQQVNLTRFSLFFPEKRDFFLESQGIFDFPTVGAASGGGGATPTLFFSRRIGLQGGQPVPILAGGRLTGKVGSFDVGALSIQTDEAPGVGAESTNFTVLRLRRDVFQRSSLGILYAGRSRSLRAEAAGLGGSNETYGADAAFAFFEDVYLSGYWARTGTPGIDSLDASYQARFNYDGDEAGLQLAHLLVEEEFNPEVGFLRRSGFRQSRGSARLSPRPESIGWIRQVTLEGTADYLENDLAGFVESRETGGRLGIELENSDQITVRYSDTYELLENPFPIHEGVTIPVGRYGFEAWEIGYSFGPQRFFSGNLSVSHGEFYDGELTSVSFRRGRMEILRQLSLEPTVSYNRVELPQGSFNTTLAVARLNYTFTPRMFLSGLVQYNSSNDTFGSNLRLRWEYAPGSEIFLVYTEERDTDVLDRFSRLSNRGLVLKVNRLVRF